MIQWAVKKWPRFFGGTPELRSSLSLHWLLLGRLVVCYFLLLALVITEVTHTNQNTQQIILAFTVLTILFGISLLSGLFLNVTSSQNWLGYTNIDRFFCYLVFYYPLRHKHFAS